MSQNPKKLKCLWNCLKRSRERTDACQITSKTRFVKNVCNEKGKRIYDQTKRKRTCRPQTLTSNQPIEMEVILASLDCDFLNLVDIALEISIEQEPADSSDEEVHCAPIVSNNTETHLKCFLGGCFAMAYYDHLLVNANSAKHYTLTVRKLAQRVIIISVAVVMIRRLCSSQNSSASRGPFDQQKCIKTSLPRKHVNCSAMAWTGIAEMLLPGEQTNHNVLKF